MHTRTRVIGALVLFGLIAGPLSATIALAQGPTASEYGVVLNLSGRQRMLTQKMSKEILLVALDIGAKKNLMNLKSTANMFDETLRGLRDGDARLRLPPTTNADIRAQLDVIEGIWAGFKPVVDEIVANGSVTPAQIAVIAEKNLPLLKEMNNAVKMYEVDASAAGLSADPGLAVTINLSGKQRMLSQKMSKEYLLIAYGHEVEANRTSLKGTYELFDRTLLGLLDGNAELKLPGTPQPNIRAQLAKVQTIWSEFMPAMVYATDPEIVALDPDTTKLVAIKNQPLLKEMNKAVKLYELSAAQVSES